MWRSFFLAVGVMLCILGVECLGVQEVVFKARAPAAQSETGASLGSSQRIIPPEYAPWSLMGLGAVVILYAYDLPRRMAG
jgi:hypothetical protein